MPKKPTPKRNIHRLSALRVHPERNAWTWACSVCAPRGNVAILPYTTPGAALAMGQKHHDYHSFATEVQDV